MGVMNQETGNRMCHTIGEDGVMVKDAVTKDGHAVVNDVYTPEEVQEMRSLLKKKNLFGQFGVRRFLKDHPEFLPLVLSARLKTLLTPFFENPFIVRSIYFDKPPNSNWVVQWHQDLTVNLIDRKEADGFTNWRILKDRAVAQPDMRFLKNMITLRIHLDHCDSTNGALRVVSGSHTNGVIDLRVDRNWDTNQEATCEVGEGGVMIMKPLLLHSSRRTENLRPRRVIHIEFCSEKLPAGLEWDEFE